MREACERHYTSSAKNAGGFLRQDVWKLARGEPRTSSPAVSETRAKIAKNSIAKNSSLAVPENLQELIAPVEAVEHERAVANGLVITLSEAIALLNRSPGSGSPPGARVAESNRASRTRQPISCRKGR